MMYQLYLGPGTVYVEDPENENIFDSGLSYVKGSWILHMLRRVVGEDNFFDILKAYYASPKHKYGSATTEQFQAVCEQVSGINLDKFFYQWMHEEFYPHYSYSWNWTQSGSGFDINLEIRQEQTNHIFWMPIDITITTTTGETTFVVWDSLASQTFQLNVSSQPENLELDKNNWILKLIPEEIINPIFDRGILLVNGVMLDSYGDEIRNSYERRAFWGDFPITFWDCFNPSQTGYASTLPEPIGFGKIPADFLGQFSTVIWVGNDYGGDLGTWQQTSILSYLEAGGNVLLMTRNGQNYIHSDLQKYFGLIWTGSPRSRLNNCVATFSGLTDMQVTGNQTYNSVFEKEFTHNQSTLLFQETASFDEPVGLGVWCDPEEGGLYRKDGGQFVFISGRPYRYNAEHLRDNVEFILEYLMLESMAPGDGDPVKFRLEQNYPNPFKKTTTIRYYLNQPAGVTIKIYNMQGELVKSFLNREPISGGQHDVTWDGKNSNGTRVSSGVYFCRLNTSESSKVKKMLVLK